MTQTPPPGPHRLGIAGSLTRAFIASPLTPLMLVASLVFGLVALMALPREEVEFSLTYYNSATMWLDIDQVLQVFGLARGDLALSVAIAAVTTDNILQTLQITHAALMRSLGRPPRIAVAGLNPHAGEGGLFGSEEVEVIAPALAAARDLPCPTNAAIANLVGLRDELAASYRLGKLRDRRLIRIDVPADPRLHRVVTIVASGKKTRGGAR